MECIAAARGAYACSRFNLLSCLFATQYHGELSCNSDVRVATHLSHLFYFRVLSRPREVSLSKLEDTRTLHIKGAPDLQSDEDVVY